MNRIFFRSCLMLLAYSCSWSANAEDIALSLPITAVTVHPYSAVVVRSKEIQLPTGEHQLIITNIPASIDPARLILSIPDSSVRMGSLDITQNNSGSLISELEQRLRDELMVLLDARTVITDDIATANTELALLSSLASGGNESGIKPTVNAQELANLIGVIGSNSNQARARIRTANIEMRELDIQINAKQFEINQIATNRVLSSDVTAQLQVSDNVSVLVALSYPENNASWSWLYEARLDTTTASLEFFRQAVVRQNSGEDWNNIDLTLTTADQRRNTRTPELSSQFVDVYEVDFNRNERVQFSALEEIVVTGSRITRSDVGEANVIATQYLVDFSIPGKTTVIANQQDKVVPIDNNNFAVELVARSVPTVDTLAYLEARFNYQGDIPFQAAPIQLYRDGAFIGDSRINAFLPQADISLPFGVDELIRIEIRNEEEQSRSASALRRNNIEDFRQRFEVSSFHAESIPLEIISQIPVSTNSRIEVEISSDATLATQIDVDGKAGLLMWELELAPQQQQNIRHYYSIKYPKDVELDYRYDN